MRERSILLSGAGIAGSTLAYWLARRGFDVTVVERSQGVRSSGNPVDVRGAAVDVVVGMGVMERLQEVSTKVEHLRIVNAAGRRVAGLDVRTRERAAGGREVEVPRADLAGVLLEAGRREAHIRFDQSIAALHQDAGGVDVTFADGTERRFDAVVGCDGMHSAVRRLEFGPEAGFVRHLGLYVGTLQLDGPLEDPSEVLMYNTPGRSVSVHPGSGRPLAAFIFRGPERADFDYRDLAQHKRLIEEAYAGNGWRVPELLERVRAADDLYFDAVSQVRIPRWSSGRVALLGDAASSVSLFGEGSSLAIVGAARLADALAAHPDPTTAFARFEAQHRPAVLSKQRLGARAARLIVPATRAGLAMRNAGLRLVSAFSRSARP
ncbi:FAD-dependent oxidoreductase [Leifsonia poae]|uniref:FAD-dependent oxidoreductase n=1 Tax=Leifsonia poae TaxID=110933 RepID=UPI001CBA7B41|nr:FAD-dependent oxidoreductase [Leifsonia poae]